MMTPPFVSIIIPCRNEKKYLAKCLDSVIAFDYPKDRMELLVSDGMSLDGTRDILQRYQEMHSFIRILDNVKLVTPRALNLAITNAIGDVILRLDAHAEYPTNYVSKCVAVLYETGADNVGGIRRSAPRSNTRMANALAFAVSSPFTAGNAVYRTGVNGRRWVDTVFCGCYRKEVFEKIGLFNEILVKTQDREFNQRLRDAGGKILLDPEIECKYYARTDYLEYCRWMLEIGSWPFLGSRLARRRFVSLRNYVPLAFVVTLTVLLATSLSVHAARWLLVAVAAAYGASSLVAAVPLAKEKRDPLYLIVAPIVFLTTHVLYGIGSLYGIARPVRRNVEPLAVTETARNGL